MRKFMALCMAMIMVMTLFSACGSDESHAEAPAKENGNGSLVIWVEKSFSEEVDKLMADRISQFAEEYGVNVKSEFISAVDYVTKLNAALEVKEVPDITLVNPYKIINYYPNIPYEDVTDLVDEINQERPMFESLKEGSKIADVNYYVPFYAASSLLFVRKDLFDAKGIPLPTTWDELWDAAIAVADPENGIYGLGVGCGPTDEDCENSVRTMLWDNGGALLDEEGNIVAADNAGLSKIIDKYEELYKAGAIPPAAITWDPGGNNKTYLMGESAMVINVPTLYNAIKNDEQYAELLKNTVVMNLPAGSESDVVFGNPSGWGIMKDAKNKENARKFIKYMADKEWYDGYMDAIAPVFAPVYMDLVDSATWSEGVNKQAIEYVQNATGYYGYPCKTLEGRAVAAKNYYTFPIAKVLNSVVTGSATKEEAIEELVLSLQDARDFIAQAKE